MSLTNFKEKAIEYVKQAVEADNNQQYDAAFKLYMSALEHFSAHIKYDKNPKAVESIKNKMKEYLDRAEYLKTVINENTRTDSNTSAGTPATAVGQKKKPEDHNEDAEKAKLRAQLGSAIVTEKPNVRWDDVSGLEHAKEALKEAVILPVKFPQA